MNTASPTNSGEQQLTAEERVLQHIARYRLSFTEVIEHICFHSQSSRKTLEKLCRGPDALVQKVGGFQGRRKAFTLTKLGSKKVAGTVERSKPPSPTNIKLLAFCCLAGRSRVRLEQAEIEQFFGTPLPGRYLVMQCSGNYCLHSVYAPGPNTKDATIVSSMEERLGELIECEASGWDESPESCLLSGRLRVTALVETKEKAIRLSKLLQRRFRNFEHDAVKQCRVEAARTNHLEELLGELRY